MEGGVILGGGFAPPPHTPRPRRTGSLVDPTTLGGGVWGGRVDLTSACFQRWLPFNHGILFRFLIALTASIHPSNSCSIRSWLPLAQPVVFVSGVSRPQHPSMRKSKMSRVDVATKAQSPLNFDPASIRSLFEPNFGSLPVEVQFWMLPSKGRDYYLPGCIAVTRTRFLHASVFSQSFISETFCFVLYQITASSIATGCSWLP